MEIELKKVVELRSLSDESIAFTASLYIDGKRVGIASNTGKGGQARIDPLNIDSYEIIKKAEDYVGSLPPKSYTDRGQTFKFKLNLAEYLDDMAVEILNAKDIEKHNKDVLKASEKSIVFGIPDEVYQEHRFKIPIAEILLSEKGRTAIQNAFVKLEPHMQPGFVILNKNIPAELIPEKYRLVERKVDKTARSRKQIDEKKPSKKK